MHIPIESFATEAIAMHRCDLQAALLGALPGVASKPAAPAWDLERTGTASFCASRTASADLMISWSGPMACAP
ncbi:hypothetical protein ACPXAZ_25440, partial [Escherichia coli]|uniref:hypothetical protein n=1 Tax=Escherichia coli TaxID=562 RepID=UPI003CE51852